MESLKTMTITSCTFHFGRLTIYCTRTSSLCRLLFLVSCGTLLLKHGPGPRQRSREVFCLVTAEAKTAVASICFVFFPAICVAIYLKSAGVSDVRNVLVSS